MFVRSFFSLFCWFIRSFAFRADSLFHERVSDPLFKEIERAIPLDSFLDTHGHMRKDPASRQPMNQRHVDGPHTFANKKWYLLLSPCEIVSKSTWAYPPVQVSPVRSQVSRPTPLVAIQAVLEVVFRKPVAATWIAVDLGDLVFLTWG